MTYDEMKRRVERLEVLRSQIKELEVITKKPFNAIEFFCTDDGDVLRPGWIKDGNGFNRMSDAIKNTAREISEEIKAEIAKLEED